MLKSFFLAIYEIFKSFTLLYMLCCIVGGFGTTQDVTQATLSAINNVYMLWRNAPQNKIYPRLPRHKSRRYGHFQHWANLTHDIIEVICIIKYVKINVKIN